MPLPADKIPKRSKIGQIPVDLSKFPFPEGIKTVHAYRKKPPKDSEACVHIHVNDAELVIDPNITKNETLALLAHETSHLVDWLVEEVKADLFAYLWMQILITYQLLDEEGEEIVDFKPKKR